jgi:hypothetical protein
MECQVLEGHSPSMCLQFLNFFPNMFFTTNARFTQCKLIHFHQKTYPNSYHKFMMNIHVTHSNLVP